MKGFKTPSALRALSRAPRRFPAPLACAVAWAAVTIAHDHNAGLLAYDRSEQAQAMLIPALFLTLAATLFAEGRKLSPLAKLAVIAAAFAAPAVAVFAGDPNDPFAGPGFYMLAPAGMLLTVAAPFLRPGVDNDAVWRFNLTSLLNVLFGLIVAVGLGLGLMAMLGGLDRLFGFDLPQKIRADFWIVCMSVVWPWQTLAGIPGVSDGPADAPPPRWTDYVASWLLIPLALIYLLLLYGFAAKILVAWDLPRGTIGWLVGGLAAFGLAAWSAAWPLRQRGNRLVRAYCRHFHFALAVPVLLLAIGVWARVAEYGITEKRYALGLLTAWLGGVAVHGMLRRPPSLAAAPATFGALLILATFGPWGATAVSVRSQLGQLETLLISAGIMVDGRIRPAEGLAGPAEVKRISSIVDYMRQGGRRDELEAWLTETGASPAGDEDNEALMALMGLDYVEQWYDADSFSHSVGEWETMDVAGFDIAHQLRLGGSFETVVASPAGGPAYRVQLDGEMLTVGPDEKAAATLSFDLDALAETLRPLDVDWGDAGARRAMTLEAQADGLRVRLLVENMGGQRTSTGNEVSYGNALLLIGRAE